MTIQTQKTETSTIEMESDLFNTCPFDLETNLRMEIMQLGQTSLLYMYVFTHMGVVKIQGNSTN